MEAVIFFVFSAALGMGWYAGYNRGWIAGADEMVGHIEVEPDPIGIDVWHENVVPIRKAA